MTQNAWHVHKFGGSSLTDSSLHVAAPGEPAIESSKIPLTYVPFRNTHLLAIAASWAETLHAERIMIGIVEEDASGYPDCRPVFIRTFEQLANVATRAGVEGSPFHIHAPLIQLSKAEIILRGQTLGINFALTVSCYDPGPGGEACGVCES